MWVYYLVAKVDILVRTVQGTEKASDHGTGFGIVVAKLERQVADGLRDAFNTHSLVECKPVILSHKYTLTMILQFPTSILRKNTKS